MKQGKKNRPTLFFLKKNVSSKKIDYKLNNSFFLKAFILLSGMALYNFIPEVKVTISQAGFFLRNMDVVVLSNYLVSFRLPSIAVSILLSAMELIISPGKHKMAFVNLFIYGWLKGNLIYFLGTVSGAVLLFFIARFFIKNTLKKGLSRMKLFTSFSFKKKCEYVLLAAILLPFIPNNYVSVLAGLSTVKFLPYLAVISVGQFFMFIYLLI